MFCRRISFEIDCQNNQFQKKFVTALLPVKILAELKSIFQFLIASIFYFPLWNWVIMSSKESYKKFENKVIIFHEKLSSLNWKMGFQLTSSAGTFRVFRSPGWMNIFFYWFWKTCNTWWSTDCSSEIAKNVSYFQPRSVVNQDLKSYGTIVSILKLNIERWNRDTNLTSPDMTYARNIYQSFR